MSRSLFRRALSRLDVPFSNYTFVDYGAGKGKALMLACEYPFRRIVGVECLPVLCEAARANLARHPLARARGDAVVATCADARAWDPPIEPLVCFFFNPFDATVWRVVLRRLARHHAEYRLPIHIVYVNFRGLGEIGPVFQDFPAFGTVVEERHLFVRSTIPASARPR